MKGYESKTEMREKLINALKDAWEANPQARLGQLIYSIVKNNSQEDLFDLHDEKFLSLLENFVK